MTGVAVERWSFSHIQEVTDWLTTLYGPTTLTTWYIDQDYDLLSLVFNDEIATVYFLRWT